MRVLNLLYSETGRSSRIWPLWMQYATTAPETLYASLLFYSLTGDEQYMRIHDKTLDYVRNHFINPDKETGEWIQILTREGLPQDKVVALPVKDPFHITRNLLLICELLSK